MWVTVPNGGECMIRMVLPTASFLPGCHTVGSGRGDQRGVLSAGALRLQLKGTDLGGIGGSAQS